MESIYAKIWSKGDDKVGFSWTPKNLPKILLKTLKFFPFFPQFSVFFGIDFQANSDVAVIAQINCHNCHKNKHFTLRSHKAGKHNKQLFHES